MFQGARQPNEAVMPTKQIAEAPHRTMTLSTITGTQLVVEMVVSDFGSKQ